MTTICYRVDCEAQVQATLQLWVSLDESADEPGVAWSVYGVGNEEPKVYCGNDHPQQLHPEIDLILRTLDKACSGLEDRLGATAVR